MDYDTYDRRVQLGASRHRYKDAEHLQQCGRWNGAIYLAGYAIECSLKALICYRGRTNNFKETRIFKAERESMAALHNLVKLCDELPDVQRAISRNDRLKHAWQTVLSLWRKDALRYGHKLGNEEDCQRFLNAARELYAFLLRQQGENI